MCSKKIKKGEYRLIWYLNTIVNNCLFEIITEIYRA